MNLVVQKFGGTSVGDIEKIHRVAQHVLDTQAKGHRVVLVVSAMAGETTRLDKLAREIHPDPYSRDYDMLLASGEQVSIALLSMAINRLSGSREPRARPLLGFQLGVWTDNVYSKARIQEIDVRLLKRELSQNVIPVIAGFQGVDKDYNVTTLGRGGSDTTAVAVAAALGAQCEIYTDVDGIYTTDPRVYQGARKRSLVSYEEMMEMAGLGAKVLQNRSVELAAKYQVPLYVRSSFDFSLPGTWVKESKMEDVVVSGVVSDSSQVKLTLQEVPDEPGTAATIFGELSKASVSVDVIVQDLAARDGNINISFTVAEPDFIRAHEVLTGLQQSRYPKMKVREDKDLAKVSVVGVGMQNHPGVASKTFDLLAKEGIDIKLITTSEIKISCLIQKTRVADAVKSLHQGFDLDSLQ